MHSMAGPEEKEENQGERANSLKRKLSEIQGDHPMDGPDCPSAKRDSYSSTPLIINPTGYETRVYEVARKRNTIAVMETGTGKTMAAIMLIKDIGLSVKSSDEFRRLIIFLAPSVTLVKQHSHDIKMHSNLEVRDYYGGRGVDKWTLEHWKKEVNEQDVLVMTPLIFWEALRNSFLKLEDICLVVIDECHHATGNHPYAKIMKEFYLTSTDKPKIFGMTASSAIRKGQVSELESILDSQIFTPEDQTEVKMSASPGQQVPMFYDPSPFCSLELKAKMEISLFKFEASLLRVQDTVKDRSIDMEDKLKAMEKWLSRDYAEILHCLDNLGPMCAYLAAEVCLENICDTKEESESDGESSTLHKKFLEDILSIVRGYLQQENLSSIDSWEGNSSSVTLGFVSPKLQELLRIFNSFGDGKPAQFLIFVASAITAKVIERFFRKVTSLKNSDVIYLAGNNTSTNEVAPELQKEILDSSHSAKMKIFFAANVIEEAIQVSNCSSVICFDLPTTVRSYMQCHEQARQSNSELVMLLERGNTKQRDHLYDLMQSELSMHDTALARDSGSQSLKSSTPSEENVYCVEATGALVTVDSSIEVLRQYCKNLPTDESQPELKFELSLSEELSYTYTVTFPARAAVQKIVGPQSTSEQLAMQLGCIEACKQLHQLGALDDHLLPRNPPSEDIASAKTNSSSAGAGTKKRKELHGTACVNALSGTWGETLEGAVLQAYRIDFSCDVAGELYSSFVLLIESSLDDDVGNVEIDLYLVRKFVKASVSSCGQLYFNRDEMRKAKCFQEFFFNGLFGKLFVGCKSSGTRREFLLQSETRSLWDPSYMFLLLPLEVNDLAAEGESWKINWSGIDSCVTVVEFLKKNSLLEPGVNGANHCKTSQGHEVSSEDEDGKTNLIHFANGSFDRSSLREMVVIAIHTGKIYSIVEVVKDSCAKSPFEGGTSSEYSTYADYFYKKYGIVLMHPDQPLVRLKQSHNAHNLLVNFNDEGDLKAESEGGVVKERKPQVHSTLPPELLVTIEVPRVTVRTIYLLPSVMHRLETLMSASQLRKEIDCRIDDFSVSSSLLLEAITTLLCCETFSMERLELLGDSVLKYVVSCHLYLKYPDKNEGQLSRQRRSIICNANLHRLANIRKLQEYIRDGAFEPRRWTAPGQLTLFPVPCECGVETEEVPLDPRFFTENPNVKLGKSCDSGHRWMMSKTISDCAEALIGAYYVSGGLTVALHMMKWLGVDVEFDPSVVIEAINTASLQSYVPKNDELAELQAKIGHEFSVKFLLKEAITHKSVHEPYSYERLEFLGDSVLDILITRHLYETYTERGPGDMTDLRSDCVCNENFAQVAVRKDLYSHLQHRSTVLETQIDEYLRSFSEPDETGRSTPAMEGPKALGDLVESITGALLIDTRMNLSEVWRVLEPLLAPLVTPDKLELPPFRELNELCDSLGYHFRVKFTNQGEKIHATIQLQLHDVRLIGVGSEKNTKQAKGKAASSLLKQLEKRNISRKARDVEQIGKSDYEGSNDAKLAESPSDSTEIPVIGPISTKKGGPRTTLFDFCKKHLWPSPTFDTTEEKSRKAFEFGEGAEKRTSFSSFTSIITIWIPDREAVTWSGEARPDKKSSFDSAVVEALHELERRGLLVIQK